MLPPPRPPPPALPPPPPPPPPPLLGRLLLLAPRRLLGRLLGWALLRLLLLRAIALVRRRCFGRLRIGLTGSSGGARRGSARRPADGRRRGRHGRGRGRGAAAGAAASDDSTTASLLLPAAASLTPHRLTVPAPAAAAGALPAAFERSGGAVAPAAPRARRAPRHRPRDQARQ